MIYIDYPTVDNNWLCIKHCKTKAEAIAWLRDIWGEETVTDEGFVNLLSGNEEESDDGEQQP